MQLVVQYHRAPVIICQVEQPKCIDRIYTILYITPEPAASTNGSCVKWAQEMKIVVLKATEECCTVGVGAPRSKLRERVSCSNREMFYAAATVTTERMK